MTKKREISHFSVAIIIIIISLVFSYWMSKGVSIIMLKDSKDKIDGLEKKVNELEKRTMQMTSIEDVKFSEEYSWDCIDWYADCGNIVYDNRTGFFVQKGFIDSSCENACKTKTLHYYPPLPTIKMTDKGVEVQLPNGTIQK